MFVRASKNTLAKLKVSIIVNGGDGVEELVAESAVYTNRGGGVDNLDDVIDTKLFNELGLWVARVARLTRIGTSDTRLVLVTGDKSSATASKLDPQRFVFESLDELG
jgi:hypothetical protein